MNRGKGCLPELDRLEELSLANLLMLNEAKCKVLGWVNPKYKYRLGDEEIESSPAVKDLRILVDMTHQCVLVVQKASRILGCIKRSTF